ncbi:hypothetical protein RF11_03494 [Thelohanellus kitauei]|uniref:Uncharacterized protein n=1 Tax=Thelohanellus kitauei TaxID=669202 RepID=A0A0C2MUN8_THEKT|nr:hypothetical protein RF11_03494 [Thelohanellus kitauei]
MENPMKDESEQTGTTGSCEKSEDNYYVIVETAEEHQRCERFEAADLASSCRFQYIYVVSRYEDAATCFLKLKDNRALTCIRKATDVYVENRHIEQGIEFIIRWGYKCGQKLGDTNKADELYQKADELRSEYKLPHTCVITEFVESEFGGDVNQALKNAYHIYNQNIQHGQQIKDDIQMKEIKKIEALLRAN